MQDDQITKVLRANAAVTGACGGVMLLASSGLAELMEVERAVVVGIALFFLVLAADVAFLTTRSPRVVRATGRLVSVADAAWALGTLVVVAAGLLSPAGAVLALGVAAVTTGFAVAEHRALDTDRRGAVLAT